MTVGSYIKLVCLDIGGVMMRILRSWEQALVHAHIMPPTDVTRLIDRIRSLQPDVDCGRITSQQFARQISDGTAVRPEQVMEAINAWLVGPYPGIDELIERLGDQPVQIACLSNTLDAHWQKMTQPGPHRLPLDRMAYLFASFQVGATKPDMRIYQHVEQTTGLPPSSILYFDDHLPYVEAARQRDWHAELVDPNNNPPDQIQTHLKRYGVL